MGLTSSLKPCVLLLFLCLFRVSTSKPEPLTQEPVLFGGNFQALYVFGDSLVDSGNNNHLETQAKSNYPPYGVDFEGGVATGRTGNGKTIADYIAIYYGLPLVPAYLGLSEEERNNISTGINYASASCGVFPESGSAAGHCLSMPVQVALFSKTKENNLKKIFKTEAELTKHLANSLFFTAIGVNDYNSAFNETTDDPNEFADKLLHAFLVQIQRLHWLGARKFFINNIKPLGCYPNIVAHTTPRGSCNHGLNRAVAIYNAKLKASLPHIMRKLSGTSFLHSDYFNFMLGLRGPSRNSNSNLVDMTTPCCPNNYTGNMFCTPGSSSCKVPDDTHIFFDPFHPTQLANFIYSMACFHEREVCHVVRG